jgi:hypothetical protein
VITGNSFYEQADKLNDTLKLIFETSLLPKYNIFKSEILKEEITLELKMQFHKKNFSSD